MRSNACAAVPHRRQNGKFTNKKRTRIRLFLESKLLAADGRCAVGHRAIKYKMNRTRRSGQLFIRRPSKRYGSERCVGGREEGERTRHTRSPSWRAARERESCACMRCVRAGGCTCTCACACTCACTCVCVCGRKQGGGLRGSSKTTLNQTRSRESQQASRCRKSTRRPAHSRVVVCRHSRDWCCVVVRYRRIRTRKKTGNDPSAFRLSHISRIKV